MEAQTADTTIEQPSAPAAPAPPSAPPARPSPLSSLDADERQAWSKDGKLPDRLSPFKAQAAETPAATSEDAPAVDAQNKPILGADGKPLSRRAADAERRTREAVDRATAGAVARAEAAERRAAEAEARLKPAEPAKPEPAAPAAQPAADREPQLEDFLDQPDPYLALSKAVGRWEARQVLQAERAERAAEAQQTATQRQVAEQVQTYQERENAFKAAVPDFDARTLAFRQILNPIDPIGRTILGSDLAPQLILHLAERPDVVRRIGALAQQGDMTAALRVLFNEERSLSAASAPAAPAAPQPKTVSDAPAIGTTLGTQPAAAADASRSALARKDFRAFDEVETAKELERFRARRKK